MVYGFLNRNPEIALREPEGTSLNRIAAFNAEEVKLFYSNLEKIFQRHRLEENRIFNMDEAGITTVQKKCPKVYSRKRAKKVEAATSGELGRTITGVFCVSAAGNYIPLMLIYPRQRMTPTLQKNGPIDAIYKCSKNGWINSDLYLEWLQHFAKYAKPTAEDPLLLVLKNHSSHISVDSYNFCKTHNIHVVSLPPHTSHQMQPLDLTFFYRLKNALYREYDLYLTSTGHEKITEYDIAELLNKAFIKVATMEKAASGFRSSGIFPFNPNQFNDDFAPANELRSFIVESTAESGANNVDDNHTGTSELAVNAYSEIKDPIPLATSSPTAANSNNSFFDFAPIPKKRPKENFKKVSRSKQHSEILTSTPMKDKLDAAEEKKKTKKQKVKSKPVNHQKRTNKSNVYLCVCKDIKTMKHLRLNLENVPIMVN